MIVASLLAALGQMHDGRFLRVVALGVGLSVAMLAAVTAGFVALAGWLLPETVSLPYFGEVGWITHMLEWGIVPLMLVLSVFLMVPVASAFTGLFLESVAEAVEDRHYPHLPKAQGLGLAESLRDAAGFLGVVVLVNLVALVLYFIVGPLAPLVFWVVNGYLLGREYFTMAAARRIGTEAAGRLRRRWNLRIWAAGTLMALPLSVPLLNLLVPVLGAAAFTHLYHRIAARDTRG